MRQVRTLRARRRGLETESRITLPGHAGGNRLPGGMGLSRFHPTRARRGKPPETDKGDLTDHRASPRRYQGLSDPIFATALSSAIFVRFICIIPWHPDRIPWMLSSLSCALAFASLSSELGEPAHGAGHPTPPHGGRMSFSCMCLRRRGTAP